MLIVHSGIEKLCELTKMKWIRRTLICTRWIKWMKQMIAKTRWCMSKGMICELQCEKVVGRGRRTTDEEQVLQWVWTEVNLHQYIGRMVVRTLCVSDRCLYLMHWLILNQWRKRIYNRNDTRVFRFRSFNSGMCKWVLSLSKSIYLRLQKIVA